MINYYCQFFALCCVVVWESVLFTHLQLFCFHMMINPCYMGKTFCSPTIRPNIIITSGSDKAKPKSARPLAQPLNFPQESNFIYRPKLRCRSNSDCCAAFSADFTLCWWKIRPPRIGEWKDGGIAPVIASGHSTPTTRKLERLQQRRLRSCLLMHSKQHHERWQSPCGTSASFKNIGNVFVSPSLSLLVLVL